MCRHLAYLGSPRTLRALVYDPPHSLQRQSYAARLGTCTVNADGFGVGWYADGRTVRYRRAQPIWSDVSFAEVAGVADSGCVLAAVRSATPGFPVDESCAQPFRADGRLFSHNGRIEGFADAEGDLRDAAGKEMIPDARAPVDSALVFAIAAARWRAGRSLGDGLADTVATVSALAAPRSRLNLLAADGASLAATTWGDTLFVREDEAGVVIASEPYDDDPAWREVPDRSLLTATADKTELRPLAG